MLILALAAALIAAVFAGTTVAGPLEDAAAAVAGALEDAAAADARGDYVIAARLYRPLAKQGNAHAQYALGDMYNKGRSVPQDYAEAAKWFRMAAEQGHAGGQYSLGDMYYVGHGVPQDYAEAVKWFRMAAERGYALAQLILGKEYLRGRVVPQNYVQAHKWYSLAVSRFPASEKKQRYLAAKNRNYVAKKMTPGQITKARMLAREWKPRYD